MAEDDTNNAQAYQQQPEPPPDLKSLGNRLVGTWELSGGTQGKVTYEWMAASSSSSASTSSSTDR